MNRRLQREAQNPNLRDLHKKQVDASVDKMEKQMQDDMRVLHALQEITGMRLMR